MAGSGLGTSLVDPKRLRDALNHWLPGDGEIGTHEDSPAGCFTQNVVFHGGNYVVYSGLTDSASSILQNLLRAVYVAGPTLPDSFLAEVKCSVLAMLSISRAVSERLGHERFMTSEDALRGEIDVPDSEALRAIQRAVTFRLHDIYRMIAPWGVVPNFLAPFITETDDASISQSHLEASPLWWRPLVPFENGIVVVVPGAIVPALNHFILCCAKRHAIFEQVISRYRRALADVVQLFMRASSFGAVDEELPPVSDEIELDEFFFEFDSDKVAYVQLVTDDMRNISEDNPLTIWETDKLVSILAARNHMAADIMTGDDSAPYRRMLTLTIVGSLGRDSVFAMPQPPRNTLHEVIFAEELNVLTNLGHFDSLNLWKYARARRKLSENSPLGVLSFSFLDSYAIYTSQNQSFHSGDEGQAVFVVHDPAAGRDLRIKAARLADIHAAKYGDPPEWVSVRRRENEEAIPLYFREEALVVPSLVRLVEGYGPAIWIEPTEGTDSGGWEKWEAHRLVSDMLAYWIWQLTPSLLSHLGSIGDNPIVIQFRLENPECWVQSTPLPPEQTDDSRDLALRTSDRRVELLIPGHVVRLLGSADNAGERRIVSRILEGIGELLIYAGEENTLTLAEIERILDLHVPLGLKRKIAVLTDYTNVALNPNYVPQFRSLQDFDMGEQQDEISMQMALGTGGRREIVGREEKNELCKEVAKLCTQLLRSHLREFHWKHLLSTFIGFHEAYWHQQAMDGLVIPTRLQCFGDIRSGETSYSEEWMRFGATGTAIRTIIEIVAAEPPTGCRPLSTEETDGLLALANQVVNWGTFSDHIYHDVVDYQLTVLKSGRIVVRAEKHKTGLVPFVHAKVTEYVESTEEAYSSHFPAGFSPHEEQYTLHEYEEAFLEEFGLSLTETAVFTEALTTLGFGQQRAACWLPLSVMKDTLGPLLEWTSERINAAFSLFALEPRGEGDELAPGFEKERDIAPWKHNRRLSYLRRPLIVSSDSDGDPLVYWGPRHAYKAWNHMVYLVFSGRYNADNACGRMKALTGRIRKDKGDRFGESLGAWLSDQTDWQIETAVDIGPRRPLCAPQPLGDVDVLCIDRSRRRLYAIECKDFQFARTPPAMKRESDHLLNKHIPQHQRRHVWLKSNKELVAKVYKLDTANFEVISLVITSSEIPSTYLHEIPLPHHSFPALQREGVAWLEALGPA